MIARAMLVGQIGRSSDIDVPAGIDGDYDARLP